MSKLIPARPRYAPERRIVGFAVFAAALLLFICRLLCKKLTMLPKWLPLVPLLLSLAVLLPAAIFCLIRGKGYGKSLRFKLPRAAYIPLCICALFAICSGALLLSALCGGLDTLGNVAFSFAHLESIPWWGIPLYILCCALLPALGEELLFRGVLTAEYERRGSVRAILLSTVCFALLHFDPKNLLAYLFVGFVLACLLYTTDSLLATVLTQAFYYALSLFGQKHFNALYRFTGNLQLLLFILIFTFLISALLFCRIAARTYYKRNEFGVGTPRRAVPYAVQFYTVLDAICDPTLIATVIIAVVGIILF